MHHPHAKLCLLGFFLIAWCWTHVAAGARSEWLRTPDAWRVEQMPGGTVQFSNGVLQIRDKGGCTVWFRTPLQAPVHIVFNAVVKSTGRVSDLNCFWMATDPRHPSDLFHENHQRTGAFSTYDTLSTYYVGYGGNANSTTRFRRYGGDGSRPLLPEHDRQAPAFLLKADTAYRIEISVRDGVTTYSRNGETIFSYNDPKPLTRGWFGFRTVDSHIDITDFSVEAGDSKAGSDTSQSGDV